MLQQRTALLAQLSRTLRPPAYTAHDNPSYEGGCGRAGRAPHPSPPLASAPPPICRDEPWSSPQGACHRISGIAHSSSADAALPRMRPACVGAAGSGCHGDGGPHGACAAPFSASPSCLSASQTSLHGHFDQELHGPHAGPPIACFDHNSQARPQHREGGGQGVDDPALNARAAPQPWEGCGQGVDDPALNARAASHQRPTSQTALEGRRSRGQPPGALVAADAARPAQPRRTASADSGLGHTRTASQRSSEACRGAGPLAGTAAAAKRAPARRASHGSSGLQVGCLTRAQLDGSETSESTTAPTHPCPHLDPKQEQGLGENQAQAPTGAWETPHDPCSRKRRQLSAAGPGPAAQKAAAHACVHHNPVCDPSPSADTEVGVHGRSPGPPGADRAAHARAARPPRRVSGGSSAEPGARSGECSCSCSSGDAPGRPSRAAGARRPSGVLSRFAEHAAPKPLRPPGRAREGRAGSRHAVWQDSEGLRGDSSRFALAAEGNGRLCTGLVAAEGGGGEYIDAVAAVAAAAAVAERAWAQQAADEAGEGGAELEARGMRWALPPGCEGELAEVLRVRGQGREARDLLLLCVNACSRLPAGRCREARDPLRVYSARQLCVATCFVVQGGKARRLRCRVLAHAVGRYVACMIGVMRSGRACSPAQKDTLNPSLTLPYSQWDYLPIDQDCTMKCTHYGKQARQCRKRRPCRRGAPGGRQQAMRSGRCWPLWAQSAALR